jgi:hypothetical protein
MTSHDIVRNAIVKGLHDYTQLLVVQSSTIGNMPKYPFITYSVTSPYLQLGMDEEYTEEINSVIRNRHVFHYERVFSFTIVAKEEGEAMDICMKAMRYFRNAGVQELKDKGIVIVEVTNVTARDTFITIDYERRYGFDVRIRLVNEEIRDTTNVIERLIF